VKVVTCDLQLSLTPQAFAVFREHLFNLLFESYRHYVVGCHSEASDVPTEASVIELRERRSLLHDRLVQNQRPDFVEHQLDGVEVQASCSAVDEQAA